MIISGQQFQALCDIGFTSEFNCIIENQLRNMSQRVHLIDSFNAEDIKNYKRIFVYSHDALKFLDKFYKYLNGVTLVTHNSDYPISREHYSYLHQDNIKKWFCQNRYVSHPKLFSLPIGLANSQWPHGNQTLLTKIIEAKYKKEYLVYKNFDIYTNAEKRFPIHVITEKNGIKMDSKRSNEDYWINIAKSKFVISPHGNGVDCHRIWECLALGAIPVVQYHDCFSQFVHLPILFVDNYEQVTIDFLKSQVDKYVPDKIDELSIDYWRKIICTE